MQLFEHVAVVTGGASGVGYATAAALVRAGASVYITDIDGERGREAAETLQSEVGYVQKCRFVRMDVTDPKSVRKAAREILGESDCVDIVVNVAGWGQDKAGGTDEDAAIDDIVHRNLTGPMHVVRAFVPSMIDCGEGKIVNVSADARGKGKVGDIVRSWINAGVIAFTRQLSDEMAPHGVKVNGVCLGTSGRPLVRPTRKRQRKGAPRQAHARQAQALAEVAEAILFFASPAANRITGHVLSLSDEPTPAAKAARRQAQPAPVR